MGLSAFIVHPKIALVNRSVCEKKCTHWGRVTKECLFPRNREVLSFTKYPMKMDECRWTGVEIERFKGEVGGK